MPGRRHEHLGCDGAALAVCGRDQGLGHDPLQADRQLGAHLPLLGGWEDVDDAVDGLRRVLGVERREDEVAGLGRGQGGPDRLHVAHLADEDHVGVLAQGGLEGHGEGLGVAPSSRWLTRHRLCEWRNSIGSSMVMMCSSRVSLISLIIEASVVDLPEPVGPGDEHEAAGCWRSSRMTGGRPSCSIGTVSLGIRRKAAPIEPSAGTR
jgi:hypothetical protein